MMMIRRRIENLGAVLMIEAFWRTISMSRPSTVYLIKLRAMPSKIPAYLRLKEVLKYALRSCRLKCIEARELPCPDAGAGIQGTDQATSLDAIPA
jgi:hypothetical protein